MKEYTYDGICPGSESIDAKNPDYREIVGVDI